VFTNIITVLSIHNKIRTTVDIILIVIILTCICGKVKYTDIFQQPADTKIASNVTKKQIFRLIEPISCVVPEETLRHND
jgi:hypothetical protein